MRSFLLFDLTNKILGSGADQGYKKSSLSDSKYEMTNETPRFVWI